MTDIDQMDEAMARAVWFMRVVEDMKYQDIKAATDLEYEEISDLVWLDHC